MSANDPITISHGCRLNAGESDAMRRLAKNAGLSDAVIVNTCAVTNEAVRSSRQSIRRARRERPNAKIVVTGCAAQISPQEFADMDGVDAVLGNSEKLDPSEWDRLTDTAGAQKAVSVNDIMSVRETAGHLIDAYGDRARSFLQIQNGCDHRCTFCIIPYGRGNSRSSPVDAVVNQAKRLADAGCRELVLTGVDITSYGADLTPPVALGALVAEILDNTPSSLRLRLSSIDGAEIDDQLMERIVGDERLAPHLHLSLQAGDNLILKRMKRRHSREQAVALCCEIRSKRPEVAFGADLIAGFPTETDAMFENTLALIDDANLQYVHVFPFSPRDGAPAARMPQTPRAIIKERAARLRERSKLALHKFLDGLAGRKEIGVIEAGGRARLGNFAVAQVTTKLHTPGEAALLLIGPRQGDAVIAEPISH